MTSIIETTTHRHPGDREARMPLTTTVLESFNRSFDLYTDLVDAIDEDVLKLKLPQTRSNTLGQQLWCVVGARESYSRAIIEGQWSGFSCSLHATDNKEEVSNALRGSAEAVSTALQGIGSFTDTQNRLVINLLEHEAAHHGQLIRYIYALGLPVPDSWKQRYALD